MTTQWIPSPSSHAARTDVGIARDHNEDRYLAQPPLFVVADGLGGHSAGEVAAQMLVERLAQLPEATSGQDLVRAIAAADREIHDASKLDPGRHGMSTTCVAILLGDGVAQVSHVGDSRAYRLRAGVLGRLTEDHSVVAELVRTGIISEADAEVDDRRHMLTQALGSERPVTVSTTPLEVQAGDRFLLCSDGLSGQVPDATIEAIMVEHGDPGLAADALVERANRAGGVDNVTVIVADAQVSARAAAAAPTASPIIRPLRAPAAREPRRSRARTAIGLVLFIVIAAASFAASRLWLGAATVPSTPQPSVAASPGMPSERPLDSPLPSTSSTTEPSRVPGADGGPLDSPRPSRADGQGASASLQP